MIDLEVALPADSTSQDKPRTAPRMDLVVAQVPHGRPVSIVFWEAKCSPNGDLRANTDYAEADGKHKSGPKVIHQLRKYKQWMDGDGRVAEVGAASSYDRTWVMAG